MIEEPPVIYAGECQYISERDPSFRTTSDRKDNKRMQEIAKNRKGGRLKG